MTQALSVEASAGVRRGPGAPCVVTHRPLLHFLRCGLMPTRSRAFLSPLTLTGFPPVTLRRRAAALTTDQSSQLLPSFTGF